MTIAEDRGANDRFPHRALILSGSGRFADPWHPFWETSEGVAGVLRTAGFATRIADVDDALGDPRRPGLQEYDLLVVNIGAPSDPDPDRDPVIRSNILDFARRGRPLLIMHVSSTSLPAVAEWESIIGGIWVRGRTMHPDYGTARIQVSSVPHPVTAGVHDFVLDDERYSYLRTQPDILPLATHLHDGIEHPILWTHTYRHSAEDRESRIVYDALGHDRRSFESEEHRTILFQAATWLVGG